MSSYHQTFASLIKTNFFIQRLTNTSSIIMKQPPVQQDKSTSITYQ